MTAQTELDRLLTAIRRRRSIIDREQTEQYADITAAVKAGGSLRVIGRAAGRSAAGVMYIARRGAEELT